MYTIEKDASPPSRQGEQARGLLGSGLHPKTLLVLIFAK